MTDQTPNKDVIADKLKQAKAAFRTGDLKSTQTLSREIIEADPNAHEGFYLLGLTAMQTGRPDLAYKFALHAVSLSPKTVTYHLTLTDWYYNDGKRHEAIIHAQMAVDIAPQNAQAHYNLGVMEGAHDRHQDALKHYLVATEIDPQNEQALFNIATTYHALGDRQKEIDAYKELIGAHPDHAHGLNNLGLALSATGDLDSARALYQRALEIDCDLVDAHMNLSPLKTYTASDPHLEQLESLANRSNDQYIERENYLWFSLGKAREDVGRYDDAFEAYAKGNKLQRQSIDLDESAIEAIVDSVTSGFKSSFFNDCPNGGCQDETPIFILGMPRSGTTLIEQLLSSHSSVHGGDELKHLMELCEATRIAHDAKTIVDLTQMMDVGELSELGQNYVDLVRQLSGTARFITDKLPSNYYWVGLIPLILPNAKIIHSRRNPLDSCFSNFARLYNEGQLFTYDLSELGREYVRYDRLMKHWHEVVPEGIILDVQYEDMVADIEGQARRLLEFCGLPWEDQVLDFHKNKRAVTTASAAQVRKPIYTSSVARWQRFEKHLAPLKQALGDHL